MIGENRVLGRYEQMLATSATAAICAGPDNRIVSWNSAAEQLFGYSAEQAVGQSLAIIIPPRHRALHEAGFARAARTGVSRLVGKSLEILAVHANGQELPVDFSLSMWTEAGVPMFGALVRDITDRQAAQMRLEYLAHCDALTSLPNRNALHVRLASTIATSPCSLLLLDLDGFKHVNDTLGHTIGDALLTEVAARIDEAAGASGFVARLGGDEFAVLIADCTDPFVLNDVANRIFQALKSPFELAGQSLFVGTSIGIAIAHEDSAKAEHLLSSADLALYSAKSEGGGVRRFFIPAMQDQSEQRHRLGTELRHALACNEFEVWYQPQVALTSNRLCGVEALLRWRHREHGLLSPQSFISVLEDSAIAEDVGDWIIDEACAAAVRWKHEGLGAVRVGVNLFPVQLRSGRLVDVISTTLARYGLAAGQLEIEITENTVLRHNDEVSDTLRKLKAMGVRVAFDDFGTGFASLSLLQKYPLDRLKIDKSFIEQIDRRESDAAIVEAVIGLAKTLGLTVIAEGVETAAQEAALLRLGCGEAQGYRYGRAMPASDVSSTFRQGTDLDQPVMRFAAP